jgi:hypothetical protein
MFHEVYVEKLRYLVLLCAMKFTLRNWEILCCYVL